MKKNTGSFGNMAFDTGSNRAYRVGGRVTPDTVATPSAGWTPGTPQQPEQVQPQEFPQFDMMEEQPQDWGMRGQMPGNPTPQQMPGNPTPQQMLQAIFEEAWTPQLPTTEQLQQRYEQTGEAYPIMSMRDGTVKYSDGSVRQQNPQEPPMPIATMANGTILWSDGYTRQMPEGGLASYMAGVKGLSQFIFGQDQKVTQQYGNQNPSLGYGSRGHLGTDFRTRDLEQREMYAPVPMRVVQTISADSGSPYGNSILLELPSGEMLRLSHLSNLGQFEVGQVLNPGDLIGTPGNTGNSTGEHLDVEYYNTQGQLDNPNNFRANAQQYSIANQITGISPYLQRQSQQSTQATQSTQQVPSPTIAGAVQPMLDAPRQAVQAVGNAGANAIESWNPTGKLGVGASELMRGDVKGAQTELTNTINTVKPTGQFDAGLTEGGNTPQAEQARLNTVMTGNAGQTNPLRYLAGNLVEKVGDMAGLPEGATSELIAGTQTRRSNVANASNGNYQALPQSPYQGDQYTPNIMGDANRALDYTKEKIGETTQSIGNQLQAKAGEGVNFLKSAGQGITNLISNGLEKIMPKRVVGDESGSVAEEVGQTTQMVSAQPKNDIRDPFFKQGGAQQYSKYLAPDAETKKGGALSLDLFSPDFFTNADNVANVFGNTFMGKEATDKFRANEASKYPLSSFSPMSYAEGYDRGDVDRYNQAGQQNVSNYNQSIQNYLGSIPSVLTSSFSYQDAPKPTNQKLTFGSITRTESNAPKSSYSVNATPQMSFARGNETISPTQSMSFTRSMNAPTPKIAPLSVIPMPKYTKPEPKQQPTLEEYLRKGKTVEQWYAETGRQGEADRAGGAQKAANAYFDAKADAYRQNEASQNSSQDPKQVQANAVSDAILAASQGKAYISNTGNKIPNYTPARANMTDAGTGLPVVANNNKPYPIATMKDGRTKYSDGSIR